MLTMLALKIYHTITKSEVTRFTLNLIFFLMGIIHTQKYSMSKLKDFDLDKTSSKPVLGHEQLILVLHL